MSTNHPLNQFIADLFLDQDMLKRYLKDPGEEMRAGGLGEEEQRVLKTGDFQVICKYCRRGTRPTPQEQIGSGSG